MVAYNITDAADGGKQITYYIVETEEIVGSRVVYLAPDTNIQTVDDVVTSAENQLPQFQANPYWLMGTPDTP